MVSTDYTWAAVEQFQWCFVEVNAGVLCASIPALKSFFARYLPGLINSRLRSNDRSKNTEGYDTLEKGSTSRSRGRKVPDIYEMTVVDDEFEKTSAQHNINDDETRLWTGQTKGVIAHATAKPPTAHVSSSSVGGDRQIHVISETRVEYGSPGRR